MQQIYSSRLGIKKCLENWLASHGLLLKFGALHILHFYLRLQWLLTPSHFSTLEFKVNLNKIKIPLIARLLIIFVFQSPNNSYSYRQLSKVRKRNLEQIT